MGRAARSPVDRLRLDLTNRTDKPGAPGMTVHSVTRDDEALSFEHDADVLSIELPAPSAVNETAEFKIDYSGKPATGLIIGKNKYGERTFFSDNWPDKARNWLPTVDHISDKATCEFLVVAPSHFQVVSNGLLVEQSNIGADLRLTHWKQSVPNAPWLYVLAVANLAVQ